MELSFKEWCAIGLMALFLIKAIAVYKSARIQAYNQYLNTLVFLLGLVFLSYSFYRDGLYMGILAVGLGGLAIGKYFYDMAVSDPPEDEQEDQR